MSSKRATLDMPTLESWLWDAACAIRGAMDAPKFKDYILPLIFIKRLSDVFEDELAKLAGPEYFGERETAWEMVEVQHELVRFFIPRRCMWPELRKLTKDIGQSLTEAVRDIADENEQLQGVIDIVDFNAAVSGERIIPDEKLSALIEVISRHRIGLDDTEPDIIGRAYEYLLRKFAEGQGQSAGEFYTPREVGLTLAYVLDPKPGQTVYDPACGSAALLVKVQLVCRERHDTAAAERPLQLLGQEQSPVTYAMARMNMMSGDIRIGDTLRNPKFLEGSALGQFDLVVANPMWNQDGYDAKFYDEDPHQRFALGYPPANTADWGWVQHMFASLAEGGRAGVVLDTGAVSRGSGPVPVHQADQVELKETDFGQVPAHWKLSRMGDCATVQTGVAKGRKLNSDEGVTLPYLRVANVQAGYLDLSEIKYITIRRSEIDRYLLRTGDVVLTEGGDFDKLGRGFIWNGAVPNCVHQNHIFAVRPNRKVLSSEFLAYQTQSEYGKSYFLAVAHKTTNLACINTTKLKGFPCLIPSHEEQRRIVEWLCVVDQRAQREEE